MATTHALAGLLLGACWLGVVPEFGLVAMLAGFAGGIAPDLDLYWAHRKTLHFPVYYSVATVPALAVALAVPSAAAVAVAAFLLAAAVHSLTDVFGGGLELRPWEGTSEEGVYSHYHGRWLRPRRWVAYDGAPADLALAAVLAFPVPFVAGGPVEPLVAATVLVSIGYAAVRKRLPDLAEGLEPFVPAPVRAYVPERYL